MQSSITHIRPRFELKISKNQKEVLQKFQLRLDQNKEQIKGKIVDEHIILDIPDQEVHFWSPQMNFRVEESEENNNQTVISGIIGPRPSVWTLFMFVYFAIGIIGFFISSYGISKWMMDEYSHSIWAFPIAILIMLTAYQAGKYGESLGANQVNLLKQFLRDVLELDKN